MRWRIYFFLIGIFFSCSNDLEILNVQREGVLVASIEGEAITWRSREYRVSAGPSVIKNFNEPEEVSKKFRRYYFMFNGLASAERTFELTVALDMADVTDFRHNYTVQYDLLKGGLHEISLILKNPGTPTTYDTYELCAISNAEAFFEIKRQNQAERLITGSLKGRLCSSGSLSGLNITIAEFKDIAY
ncbi:MAG: hypothetical protein KF725_04395 [Cyclobacteriaceae bacterium]|nr:hypothetical protein [Cyclobacteriaceae bacterium]UYN85722.1 MAG: hypothetical protein KIT51_12675 [Cyclobacteriaceae bacterium]